ncbi:hypothetical protein [Jatrophihabitans sp. GAS493]|uniref:ribbon-helix-helix domain-containing protein n=1 Tax=Jatrophihabitans sp. GAS493 TaxID=1907575 RepID=UPI0012FDEB7B|nr:hypothetical protein [Jatrophihabitans sp. GAS493]
MVGPDLGLDEEEFILKDGRRLTNELADEIANEMLAEVRRRNLIPGGKSLSGGSVHSPRVQFRVPEELRAQAERVAEDEGVSLSALARHALEDYVRSRAS